MELLKATSQNTSMSDLKDISLSKTQDLVNIAIIMSFRN